MVSGYETSPEARDESPFYDSVRFVTTLIRAYQRYGGYTFETDYVFYRVIKALGLKGSINATPNSIIISLWLEDETRQTTYMTMTRDTDYDLDKYTQVKDLIDQVVPGKVSPVQGLERLKEIERAPLRYGNFINAIAFVLCGAGFAVIIGVSWLNVLFGGLFGLVSFAVTLFATRSERVAIIMEILATAIVAVISSGIAVVLPDLTPQAVTVCAVIWFIPGFGLTIAPREIIYHNTLSGIIYLTNALVVALKLIGGALIGIAISHRIFPQLSLTIAPGVNVHWAWLFVPLLVIGLAVLFRATPKDLGLIVIAGLLVWAGVRLGDPLGYWQGPFLGAIILTVFAKFAATRLKISSATILLPGIMILVPGFAFLKALYLANTEGIGAGISAGFQVIFIIIAIIAGVFVGDAIGSAEVFKGKKK